MATTAQKFYFTLTDQDGTWGTDVRRVEDAAPANNDSTTMVFGTGTATASKTVDPASAASSASDLRDSLGWAWDSTNTSQGMNSASGARRFIPAGNWYFALLVNIPACALGGSISDSAQYNVYRVSAAGARSLLFTIGSATKQQTSSLAATDVLLDAISAQPQITLEAGETIHIGIQITSTQVGTPVVGTTVANTQIVHLGSVSYVNLNNSGTIGVRTLYDRTGSDSNSTTDSGVRMVGRFRAASESLPTTESGVRKVVVARGTAENLPTTESGVRTLARFRSASDTVPTTDQGARSVNYQRSGSASIPTTESGVRSVALQRGSTENFPTTESGARRVNYYRGATDDLAGGVSVIEVPKPQALIIVDDDLAISLGGNLYTKV